MTTTAETLATCGCGDIIMPDTGAACGVCHSLAENDRDRNLERLRELKARLLPLGHAFVAITTDPATWEGEPESKRDECEASVIVGQVRARCGQPRAAHEPRKRPEIVCLCGSTKFIREERLVYFSETIGGRIVLSHSGRRVEGSEKDVLDALHLRKIELADRVIVVSDETGYYGESTTREIAHARALGKSVEFRKISAPPAHEIPKPEPVVELRLCEIPRLFLKPQTYRVTVGVDPDCPGCLQAERASRGPMGTGAAL